MMKPFRLTFLFATLFWVLAPASIAVPPRYDLVEIPIDWQAGVTLSAKVNDKGQVFVSQNNPASSAIDIYLPSQDYGLEQGVHRIDFPEGDSSVTIEMVNNNGDVAGSYWRTSSSGSVMRYFATYNREIIDLGNLLPLALSDDGIVYGQRAIGSGSSSGSPLLVQYDTKTKSEVLQFDYTPDRMVAGLSLSTMGVWKANALGTYVGGRTDRAAYLASDNQVYLQPAGLSAGTLQIIQLGSAPTVLPGTPDGTTIMPDEVIITGGFESNPFFVPPIELRGISVLQDINDKGQVLGYRDRCDDCIDEGVGQRLPFLYLPEPDYGLPSGIHYFDELPITQFYIQLNKITENGDVIVGSQTYIWSRGDVVTPINRLNSAQIVTESSIRDINDLGDVLIQGRIDGGERKLALLKNDNRIRASVKVDTRNVAVGEEFYFEASIKNVSDEPFVLTGVYGESYRLIGSAIPGLVQLANPPPTDALSPGEVFRQRFPFKGNIPGKIKFAFKAAGIFADGTLNLTDELITDEIQIGGDPVTIEFETLPLVPKKPPGDLTEVSIVNMKVAEDPENPDQFIVTDDLPGDQPDNVINPKVKLKITNTWERQTPVAVTIQGLDTRKRDKTPLGARAKIVGTFPVDLGTLAFGESVEREFDIDIRDDGRFDFKALLTSTPEGTTEQYNTAQTGSPIAVGVPYPAKIEFKFDRFTSDIVNQNEGAFFLAPGGSLKVIATVENLTSNAKLNFFGIEAKKELNAFSSHLTSEEGNALDPPFVHDHVVDPNAAVVLSGFITTDMNGAPKGTVTWQMPDGAFLKDIGTGKETELAKVDFLVETTVGGWLKDNLAVRIIQDPNSPPKTDLTDLEYAGLVAGSYTQASLIAMAKWMDDNIDTIGGIGRVAGSVSADPSLLADAVGEGARTVWESAEFIHLGWTSMTQAEKDKFILDAADDTWARAQLLVTAPFDKEKRQAAIDYTNAAALSLMGGVTEAYASDDPAKIAALYGTVTGNIAMEVLVAALPEPKFTRFVEGGDLAKLQKNADNVRNAGNEQQKLLRTLVSGPVSADMAEKAWGVGGNQLEKMRKILDDLGMKGYAREREPRSLYLSEVKGEAVLKPEPIKPKGFSDLDRKIFGDKPPKVKDKNGDDLELDAITVLMLPPEDKVIRERLAGEPKELIDTVIERANFRRKEFEERFHEFEAFKNGKIGKDGKPVPPGVELEFNFKDNDSAPSTALPGERRAFDYEKITTDDGGVIYVPKMANKDGQLRYITGDVDFIHFSWLDGRPLSAETAGALYQILSLCCGLQHGETISWIKNGQGVFAAKANQIGEYLSGQKALLEISGNGTRAVRINAKQTRFARNGRDHLISFDGGTKSLRRAVEEVDFADKIPRLLESLTSRRSRLFALPILWFGKGDKFSEDSSIDGQDWTYSDDPDAVMARQVGDDTLERFDGKNWIPWDPKTDPSPNAPSVSTFSISSKARPLADEKLQLTPTLVLSDDAEAGATLLPVVDFADLWANELEGHLDRWFEVGDTIVIAPGSSAQEVRRIVSLFPFAIDKAIKNSHVKNTLIAVAPDSMIANLDTIQEIKVYLDQPLVLGDRIAFMFELPLGTELIFEISPDLQVWEPIQIEDLGGGLLTGETVQLAYPGEPLLVILDPNGQKRFLRWKEANLPASAQ